MKLLLLTFLLLGIAAARGEGRVTALGRVRGNAEDRDLKGTSKTKSKSNIFHSKSRSTCDGMAVLGELINDPADQSAECLATLASIYATDTFVCGTSGQCNPTSNPPRCLAGQDSAVCYDLGDSVGQVAVQLKTAWDYSAYAPGFQCGDILTKSDGDPTNLVPYFPDETNTAATTNKCFELPGFTPFTTTQTVPPIDHTVNITVLSTGDSYIGETIPGGTVCEIHALSGYTNINRSETRFKIDIEGQEYEGTIIVDTDQTYPFPSTGRIVLNQV